MTHLVKNKIQQKRPIRSYVRREGRITTGQRKAIETLWPKYGLNRNSNTGKQFFFQRTSPITLEIGFGNGRNLINLAQNNPQNSYVGIDIYRPGVGRLLIELEQNNIHNVKIILEDAVTALPHFFKENSLAMVLVYFPDPWPKKRHQKRRLVNPLFLKQIASRLIEGGDLYVSTDCEDYAKTILNSIEDEQLLKNIMGPNCYAKKPLTRLLTKYEARGLRYKQQILDIQARRL